MVLDQTLNQVAVSLVIPTFQRVEQLRKTLGHVLQCSPVPNEILVHVDAKDVETIPMLEREYPDVKTMRSDVRQGPGGGRNRLINAATNEAIVSLDDDSWPLDTRFFEYAKTALESNASVGVVACEVIEADSVENHLDFVPGRDVDSPIDHSPVASFVGCGCIYRRSAFLATEGYLPLRDAYGMEEVDVSLQLLNLQFEIRFSSGLRVFHDCDRGQHHSNPRINAAQIRNAALLPFLRYPLKSWVRGGFQVVSRIMFAIKKKRLRGIATGIASIPGVCWRFRQHRQAVSNVAIQKYFVLRR